MSDPITQVAVDTVVQMLGAIDQASGYYTDIGRGTLTSEPASLAGIADAFVAVIEESIEPMLDSTGKPIPRRYYMNLVVEVCTPRSSAQAYRDSRRARADVVRALVQPLRTRPEGILSIQLIGTQRIVDDDHRVAKHVVAQVSVRVGLSEPRLDG